MREESKKYGSDTGSREQDRETKESLRKIAMEPTQRATSTGTGRLTTPEGQPQETQLGSPVSTVLRGQER